MYKTYTWEAHSTLECVECQTERSQSPLNAPTDDPKSLPDQILIYAFTPIFLIFHRVTPFVQLHARHYSKHILYTFV